MEQVVCATSNWREENGLIRFTVTSDGTQGRNWVNRLLLRGHEVPEDTARVLKSKGFRPTRNVTTDVVVVRVGDIRPPKRFTRPIYEIARRQGFTTLHPEVSCLIRETFSDQDLAEMGLRQVIAGHAPIVMPDRRAFLLGADRGGVGRYLNAFRGDGNREWGRNSGFAFSESH